MSLQSFGAEAITDNTPVVKKSDVIFVSVKPTVVPAVLNDVKSIAAGKLFISVAMGVTIREIEAVIYFIHILRGLTKQKTLQYNCPTDYLQSHCQKIRESFV